AAMQYSIQGLNCDDPGRKDLLMDIGTEELSHLEIVGALARMHRKPLKSVRAAAVSICSIPRAMPGPPTISRSPVNSTSIFAAMSQPKLARRSSTSGINFCRDAGTKDALQFLMTREITHMRAFTLALESMGKPVFSIGRIAPTPKLVDQFFNDSTVKATM